MTVYIIHITMMYESEDFFVRIVPYLWCSLKVLDNSSFRSRLSIVKHLHSHFSKAPTYVNSSCIVKKRSGHFLLQSLSLRDKFNPKVYIYYFFIKADANFLLSTSSSQFHRHKCQGGMWCTCWFSLMFEETTSKQPKVLAQFHLHSTSFSSTPP